MKTTLLLTFLACALLLPFRSAAEPAEQHRFLAKEDVFLVKDEPWKLSEQEKVLFFAVLGRSREMPVADGYHGGLDYSFLYQAYDGKSKKVSKVRALCRRDGALIGYDLQPRDKKIIADLLVNIENRHTKRR